MKKRILLIAATLRQNGNSDILCESFAKGAREAGHEVSVISLKNKTIGFCRGCLSCQKTGTCVIRDDANAIVEEIKRSDVILFATPLYFYEMCGQLKTLLDRSNVAFSADYAFREVCLIATAADSEKTAFDGVIRGLQGWTSCFEKAKLSRIICGGGVTEPGDIKNRPDLLSDAYSAGKSL